MKVKDEMDKSDVDIKDVVKVLSKDEVGLVDEKKR